MAGRDYMQHGAGELPELSCKVGGENRIAENFLIIFEIWLILFANLIQMV